MRSSIPTTKTTKGRVILRQLSPVRRQLRKQMIRRLQKCFRHTQRKKCFRLETTKKHMTRQLRKQMIRRLQKCFRRTQRKKCFRLEATNQQNCTCTQRKKCFRLETTNQLRRQLRSLRRSPRSRRHQWQRKAYFPESVDCSAVKMKRVLF